MRRCFLLIAGAGLLLGSPFARTAEPDRTAEESAIRAAAQEYVAAIARGDAAAALGYWTPEGDIIDESGRRTSARKRIEQDAANAAAADESTTPVELPETALRFLGPDTAIEDGVYAGDSAGGHFTAIWTKTDGRWRLAGLREAQSVAQPLTAVEELAWLAGRWVGEHDGTTFEITTRWSEAKTYLERTLTATHNGTAMLKAEQRIGVDPADGRVKCWTHDAGGGHSVGIWTRQGASWVVESRGVAADGNDLRGTSVYTPEGSEQIRWESLNNWRDGQPTLDFDVTLSRTKESQS